jgi:hypothetical protein
MLEKNMALIKYDTQMEVLGPELQLHSSPRFVSCGTDSLDLCISIGMRNACNDKYGQSIPSQNREVSC